MTSTRRHGFTFHLLTDPDDLVWFEVRRELDETVVEFTRVDGVTALDTHVERWIATQLTNAFADIEVERCRSCGERRLQVGLDEEAAPTRSILVEEYFDLCPRCGDEIVRAFPWLLDRLAPDESDVEDW